MTPAIHELLRNQAGVLALWQLTPQERRSVRRGVATRHWQQVTARTLFFGAHAPDDTGLLWAAVLHAGRHARLAGRAALVLHGWSERHTTPFDVAVPVRVSVPRDSLIRAHRLNTVAGPQTALPRVGVHDAVAQAAAWARSDREAMFIIISALQQRLVTATKLVDTLASQVRLRRRRLSIATVQEFRDGATSLNELDFAAMCRKRGLPMPLRQVVQADAHGTARSIDAEFRSRSGRVLHVEVEGLHHLDPAQWLHDVRRHNGLVLGSEGVRLRVLAWELRHDPEPFFSQLAAALTT